MPLAVDLAGRIAWVTGGASGIGLATARQLAAAGARVVALDRDPASDPSVERSCILDVRDAAAVESLVDRLDREQLGADILVNAAGITRDGVVWKLADREWDDVIDVNLSGAFRMVRAAARGMRARGRGGAIVNVASINGIRGKFGQSNYAASKGGLIAFTRAVATDLARDRVRVNAVAPGFTETPMTAALPPEIVERARREILLGRLARPDDIASAIVFLASDLAAFITGQVLVVDGGQTA
ncbi:MAG TPA: SDR family oxidoreductase [Vicinamibacterales bacterium]|nr:SDR family oxidoreductase [Vicinamibacterales bacterium]